MSSTNTLHDLLLADLHLPIKASIYNEAFLRFCAGPARAAKRVFILGDLFEYWIGDDPSLSEYPAEIAALKALSDAGVAVYVQQGNRDFMLGKAFARATGATLLKDEAFFEIAGVKTLLAHGDSYCTDDEKYQRWRRFSRNPLAQWIYLRLSVARRRNIAGALRSDDNKRYKPDAIMDVNANAIIQAFARTRVQRMIHGHTHRPQTHIYTVGTQTCERIVLADWREDCITWLQADAQTLKPMQFH